MEKSVTLSAFADVRMSELNDEFVTTDIAQ